jgi:hypothetical protein
VTRTLPTARKEGLIVQELGDETLVYDLTSHKAHYLNRTARLIWQRCNGRTTLAEILTVLENEQKTRIGETAVWMALDQLAKAQLLADRPVLPESLASCSRRDLIRAAGLLGAAALVPIVDTIVAPRAAEAASSTTSQNCQDNCIGVNLPCSDVPGKKCKQSQPGQCDCG